MSKKLERERERCWFMQGLGPWVRERTKGWWGHDELRVGQYSSLVVHAMDLKC